MSIELTVLGCSGSFSSPASGPCSGFLVRAGGTSIWLDCGNGTFERLQSHVVVDDLSAVVITHRHPDHCVDLIGLATLLHIYRGVGAGPPVLAAPEVRDRLLALNSGVGDFFAWDEVADGDTRTVGEATLRFSETDHSVPTVAVEVEAGGKRLVYTADTGPGWSASAFGSRPDLLLSEATYQRGFEGIPIHLTAAQAGEMARDVDARRLMLTHLVPLLDPAASVTEAQETYGDQVTLAAPDLRVRI